MTTEHPLPDGWTWDDDTTVRSPERGAEAWTEKGKLYIWNRDVDRCCSAPIDAVRALLTPRDPAPVERDESLPPPGYVIIQTHLGFAVANEGPTDVKFWPTHADAVACAHRRRDAEHTAPRTAPVERVASLRDTAATLIEAARAHWKNYNKTSPAAVVWTNDEGGDLIIYSRGEYREQLMAAVDKTNAPVIDLRAEHTAPRTASEPTAEEYTCARRRLAMEQGCDRWAVTDYAVRERALRTRAEQECQRLRALVDELGNVNVGLREQCSTNKEGK